MVGRTTLVLVMVLAGAWAPGAEEEPRGVLEKLYEALEAGDTGAARGTFHATNDKEKALVDAFVRQMTSAKAMAEAMKAKFGLRGDILSRGLPSKELIAQLDKAHQEIQGDRATLTIPGRGKPLQFIRVEGKWRVSIADFAGSSEVAGQTAVLNDMASAYDAIAADVQADKFVTVMDAQRALGQKLQAVMLNALRSSPPATRRAETRPAQP